jgi:hypothetical protein
MESLQGFTEVGRQKRKFNSCDEGKAVTQVGTAGSGPIGVGLKKACYSEVARDSGMSRTGAGVSNAQSRRSASTRTEPGSIQVGGKETTQSKVSTIQVKDNPVRKERNLNSRGIVVGSCNSSTLRSAPKLRIFYAGFWECGTTRDSVIAHLRNLGVSVNMCEELKTRHPSYCSFKFECDIRFKDTVMNSSNWPEGILIKRFYENRAKTSVAQVRNGNCILKSGQESEPSVASMTVTDSSQELMIV